MIEATITQPKRSDFVTGLAWIFIAIGGLTTIIFAVQTIVFSTVFTTEDILRSLQKAEESQRLPELYKIVFENFRLVLTAIVVISTSILVSAVGLLKRRNWARIIFVAIMICGVIWNLFCFSLPFLLGGLGSETQGVHPKGLIGNNFQLSLYNIYGTFLTVCLAFTVLYLWIIKRLSSEEIKREFLSS